MIIARSPLRIPIGGGGTDLPSYYERYGGFLIAGAIDKHVYVTLHETFDDELVLKYSQVERVNAIQKIQHPIIREALKLHYIGQLNLEITSMADIPDGTGLGSSGSFTTALLKVLQHYKKNSVSPQELAEQACHIEIGVLKEPTGKQDQYIASHGGINCFEFEKDGSVKTYPLNVDKETILELEDRLLLFFTGYSRSAGSILQEQDKKTKSADPEMVQNLHLVKELGYKIKKALEAGNLRDFGTIMNEHWQYKKIRSASMSNKDIDEWYDLALKNGALGGKLVGAGGGGFLMFYSENKSKLRQTMADAGLTEVGFRFEFEGTKIVV